VLVDRIAATPEFHVHEKELVEGLGLHKDWVAMNDLFVLLARETFNFGRWSAEEDFLAVLIEAKKIGHQFVDGASGALSEKDVAHVEHETLHVDDGDRFLRHVVPDLLGLVVVEGADGQTNWFLHHKGVDREGADVEKVGVLDEARASGPSAGPGYEEVLEKAAETGGVENLADDASG